MREKPASFCKKSQRKIESKNRIAPVLLFDYHPAHGEMMASEKTILLLDEEICWQAVQTRDRRYNGKFFCGVRSTGIYCRPTCPSRRPRRDQVEFFASCEEAETAGYRPCKRCQPREVDEPGVAIVSQACRLIEVSDSLLSLDNLSKKLNVSPYHLHRMFKSYTGLTPRQYALSRRRSRFKARLRTKADLSSAIFESGYGSTSRLYENAPQWLGMTPATYQRGGRGMKISYVIVDSYLGRLLVAATEKGICAVSLADEDSALEDFLASEFPSAEIIRDGESLSQWVGMILDHLEGRQPHLDLPLDVQATAFQMRVWEELRKIPYGETRTYAQVAAAIDQPNATRAVGRACATNPASILTPCHRVVRSDGSLGGYRWGLKRKQALIEGERSKK